MLDSHEEGSNDPTPSMGQPQQDKDLAEGGVFVGYHSCSDQDRERRVELIQEPQTKRAVDRDRVAKMTGSTGIRDAGRRAA